MTEVPMKRNLPEMPYEVLFEILHELPKGKLFEISRLSSIFGNVAKDTRLWKDVYIKYESNGKRREEAFAFEDLYSGPFPVKVIDLPPNLILPPASFETDQVVKVTKLIWSSTAVKQSTMKAMLAKYQCTELHLDYICVGPDGHIMEIAPETFSKQTGLEVLSLRATLYPFANFNMTETVTIHTHRWLATILSKYCINLKSLDLSRNFLAGLDDAFVNNLPTTLEKLYLISCTCPGNSFFELLAEHRPNLKEIGLYRTRLECPALLKFKFLEALHTNPYYDENIRDLYKCLIGFPTLKNVYIDIDRCFFSKTNFEALETKLKPHGITIFKKTNDIAYPTDSNLWLVSKAM